MAGDWGASHNGVKIGCFYDAIELSSDGSKARITDPRVEIYRSVNISDSTNKLSVSGGAITDDSWSNLNVGGSGTERIKTVSATWCTLTYGATSTHDFSASLSGVDYAGSTLSNTYTVTYPARAYAAPAAPSGISVVRVSDTSFNVAWVNNSTASAPYTNVYVERSSNAGASYTVVATLGAVTSWSDAGTVANNRYIYRVRAGNVSGYSGYVTSGSYGTTPTVPSGVSASYVSDSQINVAWTNNTTVASYVYLYRWDNVGNAWNQIATLASTTVAYQDLTTIADRRYCYAVAAVNLGVLSGSTWSGYVNTTPAAPINAVASKSGTSITVTWTNKATYSTLVEVWHAANGVWDGAAIASLAGTATSYTHSSVNTAQTHQYRVRAVNTRNSDYATTGVVQLLTAPLAPTIVASKLVYDAALEQVAITWVHNSVDSTIQTAAEARISILGANTWTTYTKTTETTHTFTTPTNGHSYELQVRTKGGYASFGAWSASQIVTASATPSVTINSPVGTVLSLTAVLALGWTFYDPESTSQAAWVATLSKAGQELEELTGSSEKTCTFKTALANDTSYVVTVQAQDGSGLWSAPASRTYTTDFVDPPTGTLTIAFEPEYGRSTMDIVTPAPAIGQADPIYAQVFRDGVLIADNLNPVSSTIDYVPAINTNVVYTVVVWSAIPTSSISEDYVVSTATPWVFINGGNGFAQVARLLGNPSVEESVQREKVLHQFAGRTKPVEFLGSSRSRTYKLSGNVEGINNGSELGEWTAFEDIADLPAPLVYRDPMGRRSFVSIGEVSISHDAKTTGDKGNLASVSATLTEIDYAE